MRAIPVTVSVLWIILVITACHGDVPVEDTLPSTTAKVEECPWCPALDPTVPAIDEVQDLMNILASTTEGTAFTDITEDELLSDIRATCDGWKVGTPPESTTAAVAQARASLMGIPRSASGVVSYGQLLETAADRRCLRNTAE